MTSYILYEPCYVLLLSCLHPQSSSITYHTYAWLIYILSLEMLVSSLDINSWDLSLLLWSEEISGANQIRGDCAIWECIAKYGDTQYRYRSECKGINETKDEDANGRVRIRVSHQLMWVCHHCTIAIVCWCVSCMRMRMRCPCYEMIRLTWDDLSRMHRYHDLNAQNTSIYTPTTLSMLYDARM